MALPSCVRIDVSQNETKLFCFHSITLAQAHNLSNVSLRNRRGSILSMSNEITVRNEVEVQRVAGEYKIKVCLFEDGSALLSVDAAGYSSNHHLEIEELKTLSLMINHSIKKHEKILHQQAMKEAPLIS